MIGLTPKQNACLREINTYVGKHGVAPTFEELQTRLGLGSKSEVHRLMTALQERGAIRRIPGRARAVEVVAVRTLSVDELTRLSTPQLLDLLAHVCGILGHRLGAAKVRETLDRIGARLAGVR